ncbi:MAG: radical SAM family heme chaperone HemW [Dehalococcoidales bacterium]|nr:radical SAM family heme chaperone HemW [Dehalococcoidales bacterium]
MRGLYVHIPFCVRKCCYCDFYSLPHRLDSLGTYIRAVLHEACSYRGLDFSSLYLGGGTPSLLGAEGLQQLIDGLRQAFRLSDLSESTLEANPESTGTPLLEKALSLGFNRISIGVQSLCDAELKSVGRVHTADQAVTAIEKARQAGFENISADVILGLPGQDEQSLSVTLETLAGLGVPHLSIYCLSLERHTPLALNPPSGLPSDDDQADLYDYASALLEKRGFYHYEISNFALAGYECLHNLNYWREGEYLGLGPAAASHLEGKRFKNRADLDAYISSPCQQIEETEVLEAEEKAVEEAILRLRLLREGLNISHLAEKYGDENILGLAARLDRLAGEGSLRRDGAVYRLAPACVLVSNRILAGLMGD